ncbi:uncharacterized protein I206_101575 [Kwoniella pini CBS 10737]|uniref:Uncharacterized protein n=1 Tax=Kwoniella pini CBS 10737 TaxID=1296096 RepID=A0A1B9HWA2_9TREE|nr:uncharacterized protein I206_06455 [Kwoniella pini CBS 10737]OCF47553.1 hypothetical protein I206_06455 [Kwoniella pini CBS 10737]
MSVYEWPLSEANEIPNSRYISFLTIPSQSRNSILPQSHTSKFTDIPKLIGDVICYIKRDQTEPQITTKPKHRFSKFKKSTNLTRIIPILSIFLIILTFTYLALRKSPNSDQDNMVFLKRSSPSLFEIMYEEEGVPTGFAE